LVAELYREAEFDFMLSESADAVNARAIAKEQLNAVEKVTFFIFVIYWWCVLKKNCLHVGS
jgi:chloramphenicol O-acetyltransferase